ncbi:MAG: archaea-specific SMC-related protein, partial [archaeon]
MASISIDNIGGIDHTDVEILPGVTVLAGENATNRTSFLQGLMASLGSENVSLKADAETGRAEIELDGTVYTRELTRSGESVLFAGEPYVEGTEATLADLFAFLLESNAARQAIVRREDLREIIMEPVDTAELEAEIRSLQSERDEIDEQLDHLEDLSARLPDLEERRVELEGTIESKRAEVESVREDLESKEIDPETAEQEQRELEKTLEELNGLKSRLRETENAIERTSTQLESYRRESEERKQELESAEDVDDTAIEEVASELDDLRDRRERVDEQVETLQNAIRLNSNVLEERSIVFDELLSSEERGADITDQLVSDTTVCWTCGQRADREQIEQTVDGLRTLYADRTDERQSLSEEIARLERERSELETSQQRVEA